MVIYLIFFYFKNIYGWMEFRKNTDTPKEFLNKTIILKENYTKDSIEVLKEFRDMLNKHTQSFYTKDYFDSTRLIIDSIIYSPDYNKLAVFVITQNPTYRQLMPNEKYKWYYDGYCYLGTRSHDTIDLTSITGGYSNFYDKEELTSTLREYYFRIFASIKDTSNQSRYKFNINDNRFWTCPIWQEINDEKKLRKEFEEEKIKHPENIYEPPQ